MVVAVEIKGTYGRAIFRGPEDQLEALRVIAHDALLGFCLMSTHVHLMWELETLEAAEQRTRLVARRLNSTADQRGVALLDEPHFQVLPDDYAVMRYLAYTHANPVTAHMVNDPLSWVFSSHRDVLGLRFAPWFSPARAIARLSGTLNRAWLHRTAKGLIPLPDIVDVVPREWPTEPFEVIRRAVGAVFGLTDEQMRAPKRGARARHCVAAVARIEGWTQSEIAHAMGWTERHMLRVSFELTLEAHAVMTILRDSRLRPTGGAWWQVPAEARGPALWEAWRENRGNVVPVRTSP